MTKGLEVCVGKGKGGGVRGGGKRIGDQSTLNRRRAVVILVHYSSKYMLGYLSRLVTLDLIRKKLTW